MKKVLIISSHFAPDAHIGAKRIAKFCKYLPQYGWQPIVLTSAISDYHRLDETLIEQLPDNIEIYRVKMSRLLKRFDYTLFTIRLSWLMPGFFMALRIINKQKIDIILSTTPNYEAHAIALLVKIFTRKRWVCEYRDPWIFSFQYMPIYKIIRWADRWMTRLILNKADYLITTAQTLRKHFVKLSPSCSNKFTVIYNGYDQGDFLLDTEGVVRDANKDVMVCTYLGTWGHIRTPKYFLKGVRNFLRNYKGDKSPNILINFFGEVKFDLQLKDGILEMIQKEGLGDVVFINPFISYKEGLNQLQKSDLLLLVEASRAAHSGQLSAKLFEYLHTRIPILALVPSSSEIAEIIQDVGSGEVIPPADIIAIEGAIRNAYERFQRGELQINPNKTEIAKYDRRIQTKSLANILDNLVVRGKTMK